MAREVLVEISRDARRGQIDVNSTTTWAEEGLVTYDTTVQCRYEVFPTQKRL